MFTIEEYIHQKTLLFQQCHGCKNPDMLMPYNLFQQYEHKTLFQ